MRSCLSNGRYCPQSGDYPEGITDVKGSDVLRQSLRLKCVYQHTKEKTNNQAKALEKFVGYAMRFRQECTASELMYTSSQCSRNVMKILDIDPEGVDECYYRSFGAENFEDIDLSGNQEPEGKDITFEDWINCTQTSLDAKKCPDPGNRNYECW